MARCYCRLRGVLICVCTPCIVLVLIFLYVSVMVCSLMNETAAPGIISIALGKSNTHFVASGSFRNDSFAPHPETFWGIHPDGGAFWNQLQLAVDRVFNPILHPNRFQKGPEHGLFHESLLEQHFSEVIDLDREGKAFKRLPQVIQDFMSHMHKRDYPIINQPDGVCGAGAKDEKEPPLLLLAIKTSEVNFKNRQAIRKTWGQVGWISGQKRNSSFGQKTGGYIRRVFLLGKEDTEELGVDLSKLLNLESEKYGDILQWDFKDTFFNLTLKDVLFWSWFSRFCSHTHFILKGDDDVFVNTLNMITFLQDQLKKPKAEETLQEFMVGEVIGAAVPSRVNNSKYFIPESFYKGLYPMYAGGGGVLYSGLLAKRLHVISKRVHLYPIDDVYVGMCMIRLNAYPVHHPAFLTFDFLPEEEEEACSYHRIMLVHKRHPNQLMKLWAHVNDTQRQCAHVTFREDKKKPVEAEVVVTPPQ